MRRKLLPSLDEALHSLITDSPEVRTPDEWKELI